MSYSSSLYSLCLSLSLLIISLSYFLCKKQQTLIIMPAMTKRRGTKRKIEIKKRDTKQQRSVACSKRRQTLFSKAADLCLLSGANIAVFVTSPAENNDVVYSFSGYSPASEIADCYLNGKPPTMIINPQSKLGFWWEDPDLYRYCDDLSELNVIEDRMMRTRKHLMACLDKKEKSQSVSNSDQNPSPSSLDENPKSSSPSSCDEIASFEQNCTFSSLEKICGEPSSQATCYYDQNHTFAIEDLYRDSSSGQSGYLLKEDDVGFVESLWETEKQSDIMSMFQETVL
ncbi:PREDICTED: uncharacterized protein LOC104765850 isoform X1 [Camelina sativa]|uniref:Uncharacterized protein LOC104765850 isoform X1 n=1 Tax=Camelina sativa TaxID=90675 RepID=A0ABM0XM16_CAMSA|nr:PREDICTED: uncharacterized protein LOC104765850 isoform X1 [Camelina sativa]XP_019096884.1 PREDICTED: uncharacterized protein LOC104765850 isoform X1 [Camelina sativa]XP_019096885.1 PREDICTED: uncharacterized protein LOC104765850 isoform X1 [Camelina sativa]XP_019096886.1 PREDICTED: uncharacterized protein LOC104765850 isoform X1 [Camelina sativa]